MEHELILRLSAFLGLFAAFAWWEARAPRRPRSRPRQGRWFTNLAIVVIDSLSLRLLAVALPFLAVGAAVDAERQGWGLLNAVDWPQMVKIVLAVLLLDLAIWAQHWVMHQVPLFWRFHRMHHADPEMDVSTGLRFHPVEVLASMGVKIGLIYALGAPSVAVLMFEIILNGTALFSHSNIALAPRAEALLRRVLVTPDMHRVHHSTRREDHNSNFGFALSVWDRIFGTYRPAPQAGQDGMVVGLEWQDDRPTRLGWSLLLPFRRR